MSEVVIDKRAIIKTVNFAKKTQFVKTEIIEKEKKMALQDLEKGTYFKPFDADGKPDETGPYDIEIRLDDSRFCMEVKNGDGKELPEISFSLRPFKQVIKDYFLIVESYEEAWSKGHTSRLEAIDMGRRGLHNEGSAMLQQLLEEKAKIDFSTARRLFTLVCVLCAGRRTMWQ